MVLEQYGPGVGDNNLCVKLYVEFRRGGNKLLHIDDEPATLTIQTHQPSPERQQKGSIYSGGERHDHAPRRGDQHKCPTDDARGATYGKTMCENELRK